MNQDFDQPQDDAWDDEDYVSKNQLKRESTALQKLGEELVALRPSELAKVPLDEELADAIDLAHRLESKREAKRRHLQFIGRLMRNRDIAAIEAAMDEIRNRHIGANLRHHKLEQWRDRLLAEGDDVINELLALNHELDRQKLRQLVRQAKKEQEQGKAPSAFRELFKYLRDGLEDQI
ncbi:ribosome biogenesis factor YjgA [Pseudaeromonas paramecii]|uniref:Dual-action ribosomal maturation protein DarP n=1 Tax=Pseudaeromonas paramecii TaxID=2138166 RepID=A0ABP8Q8E1_9GAMM